MARQLRQMTNKIFEELKLGVQDDHKEYIVDIERHIKIDASYRDKCCDFLGRSNIIGLDKKYLFPIAFIKYNGESYIVVDKRYADEFERKGYGLEEKDEIVVGSCLLCITEGFYQFKANSMQLIDNCLAIVPESNESVVVFTPQNIFSLIYDLSVFKMTRNELELSMDSIDDLKRLFLLLFINKTNQLSLECKESLVELSSKTVTRKICDNLCDFMLFSDDRIKFLTLYQCIEYLFIPNQASEFKRKYNMNIVDALRLHVNESMRRDERGNAMAVLKKYARISVIDKFYIQLLGDQDDENKLEKVNNWIYNLRCSIAHFRYGQTKNDNINDWNKIFSLMLELLESIYCNVDQDVKDICNGTVTV